MFRSSYLAISLALLSTAAQATQVCTEIQVCEEVCTETVYEVDDTDRDLSTDAYTDERTLALPMTCDTECWVERYCYPIDPTNGGAGGTDNTDAIAACEAELHVADQIKCLQKLGL